MVIIGLIVLGMILGSFVNALVWRLHAQDEIRDRLEGGEERKKPTAKQAQKLRAELRDLSMLHGRSMCSKCHHPLAPQDLVPFFSWLFLGGKCRYCRQPIEDPPIIELVMPPLFVLAYLVWPLPFHGYGLLSFVFWLCFTVAFVALAVYDFRWFLLPDKIVWPMIGLALLQVILHAAVYGGGWTVIGQAVWGVAVDSGIFFVLYQVSKGAWIGFGDVKLGIALGLLAGGILPALLLMFLASLLGTLGSVPLLLSKKLHRKTLIPFGPFLLAAGMIIVLFGTRLTDWIDRVLLLS